MQGRSALWLPGTDHASIATEAKITESLLKEGITKADLGRDKFLERAWEWKKEYGGKIINQLKKLGSSCDWERERFTLDEGCSRAVKKVFVKLYNEGKIYHGVRIINWCPNCRTSISDVECEYEEKDGHFRYINYPLTDGNGFIQIATTRPETLLGDTAVAVNPSDKRYAHLVGKMLKLPLTDREIPVIADEYVDKEFGTGAVKITPAHDPNDFEVGVRHKLPVIHMMDDGGIVTVAPYAGLERYEARKKIVSDLSKAGLLVKTEPHVHNVGCCQRCGTVVEPRASLQWFVRMKELAEPAINAVKSGEIKFIPQRFGNTYLSWMENIRDWCISRQLWWGHRIPAYYCTNCGYETASEDEVTKCPMCGGSTVQDEDTLDTWFSSALWPFSTLGYPDETEEYKYFYPTNTLVTGYDIIPFWVARMIFSGIAYTGKKPFGNVLIHGLVLDEQGRKMSKTLGNGTDPLEVISEFGTDALRFALVTGNAAGNDIRWTKDRVLASRNFANKLWNASRYILMSLDGDITGETLPDNLTLPDKWAVGLFNNTVKEVTANLDSFEIGVAAGKIEDYIWNIFCDWYIELTKPRIFAAKAESGSSESPAAKETEQAKTALSVLVWLMRGILKLLHPFMPFITEEIWSVLPNSGESIMVSEWCRFDPALDYKSEREQFGKVISAIGAVRSKRAELNVPQSKKITAEIETDCPDIFRDSAAFFEKLAGVSRITVVSSVTETAGKAVLVTETARIFLPMGELVDKEKEIARLEKEKKLVQKDIDFLNAKLNNAGFIAKAPPAQVEAERTKLAAAEEKMKKILESI
jgi:valyl-tRNA synthetase